MRKRIFVLLMIVLVISCNKLPVKTNKKISLFNGKNLSGWTKYGAEKWYVEDRLLVCENGSDEAFGYLKTNENYKNFELSFEFKLSEKGNSGVFVHANINDKVKVEGWQIEIAPPGHKVGGIHKYDKGWLAIPNTEKDTFFKEGAWNKMKVIVKDNRISSWLNNHEMVTTVDEELKEKEGGIALQIHGGNVNKAQWRNINLIQL